MIEQITTPTSTTNNTKATKVMPITGINSCTPTITVYDGQNCCVYNSEYPKPLYGGAFYSLDENGKTVLIYLKKVIYNAPATIAFWSDGTKTVCKCDSRDEYDPEKGLLLCQMKKMYGGELIHKLLEDWSTVYSHKIVTLADVRRKHR